MTDTKYKPVIVCKVCGKRVKRKGFDDHMTNVHLKSAVV